MEEINFLPKKENLDLKEKIKLVESIDCGLDPKIGIILILLGFKKGTDLDLFTWNENLDSVKSKIKRAGLFCDDIETPPFPNEERTAKMTIGISQEVASRLSFLFRNVQKNHEEIGRILGYPETAVEAFVGKRKDFGDDQFNFLREKGIPQSFIGFALSREFYVEEIKVMKSWVEAIKINSPDIYKKMIEEEGRIWTPDKI